MVTIDGRRYLDGGVVNNVPIGRATHLGARVVYVLHCGLHSRPQTEIRRPVDAALLAYWISRNSRFARDIATLPPSVHAIVLPPGERPEVRFDDFTQTNELMTQGYLRACEHLDALAAGAAEERTRGERSLRPDVRKVAARLPGRRHDRAVDGPDEVDEHADEGDVVG
jgi:predicted acylesterase/phospholipase RssA